VEEALTRELAGAGVRAVDDDNGGKDALPTPSKRTTGAELILLVGRLGRR